MLTYDLWVQKFSYEIPDSDHLFPPEEVGPMGPSGPLRAFVPEPLDSSNVTDRIIEEWTPTAGTYGMGGPGFLGFRLGSEWLIFAIWGAGDWFRLNGRLLTDMFWEKRGRPIPWEEDANVDFGNLFVRRHFTELDVERDSITATLDNGQVLKLSPDASDRPYFEGSGEPRLVEAEDDLRTLVFIAPTLELWV